MAAAGTWSVIPAFFVIVGGFVLFALLGVWIVQRLVPPSILEAHNEVSGFILAVVGVVYAVLLGFVAIGVWERFQAAEEQTYAEASNLTELYRDADLFPRQRDAIRNQLRQYTEAIVSTDWPAMRRGAQSEQTRIMVERIGASIRRLDTKTLSEEAVQQRMLDAYETALNARDTRVSLSMIGLNGVMWFVLVAGACVTIGYTFLFRYKNTFMRNVMVGALAAIIGLVVFLTMSLDYPFRGAIAVSTEAYEHALQSYSLIDQTLNEPLRQGTH